MRFIKAFFIFAIAACIFHCSVALLLIDAPLPAEYWVAEMIAIKKYLVQQHTGSKKIIIAGGSSTLFGIDTEYASRQLNIPVINFGLHAGLRLEKILQEVESVIENGDCLILILEPPYYTHTSRLTTWQVSNIIGWNHDSWKAMNYKEKGKFIFSISPLQLGQMFTAKVQQKFYPTAISDRLATFDSNLTLSKFHTRVTSADFQYSAYNLNSHGDLLRTEGSNFKGMGYDLSQPNHVTPEIERYLCDFANSIKKKGATVYFANTPYIASEKHLMTPEKDESNFLSDLSNIGQMIDKREDLVFQRKYFFNTPLHLNAEGRALRTNLLIKAIRTNILTDATGL
ncbi:MAG: hypothetical protein JWL59_1092 [Chthoniobacteraceae bacterium]|nr:hypothetical protein [Chthoniobacteraceae bacterium]